MTKKEEEEEKSGTSLPPPRFAHRRPRARASALLSPGLLCSCERDPWRASAPRARGMIGEPAAAAAAAAAPRRPFSFEGKERVNDERQLQLRQLWQLLARRPFPRGATPPGGGQQRASSSSSSLLTRRSHFHSRRSRCLLVVVFLFLFPLPLPLLLAPPRPTLPPRGPRGRSPS